ncbi:cytochrome P450 [Streptomyces mexicanus]|jgi:cytochrome P450|uniref:Cytochrome P450 n=1 Tax=Streptomyces mexicanus TaxID=178566 RepID=A0A7X1HXG4_9ACTN|nr:cytochrome P450 [Streptomyces mexicanus]MBC2864972.1 cytochrome P450 [Streptomyces mexicanus]
MPTERPTKFDPPVIYGELRDEAPVTRVRFPAGMEGWLVTRFDDVAAAFRHPAFAAARPRYESPDADPTGRTPTPFSGTFVHMDGQDHAAYRRLLGGRFTVPSVRRQLQPYIEQIVAERLDAIEAGPETFDLVHELALAIPCLVICELLGVPYADRDAFHAASLKIMDFRLSQAERDSERQWILDYIRDLLARKRASGDLTGLLGEMLGQIDGGDAFFTDEDLVKVGGLLLVAGHDTTANMISLSVLTMLTHPEHRRFVLENPDRIDVVVEELLRFLSIVHFGLGRTVTEDTEFRGVRMKKGELVVVSLVAANRDPRRFEDPDVLDFDRQALRHLAFGFGAHQCIGQNIARAELRAVVPAILQRFPDLRLAVPLEDVPMHSHSTNYGVEALMVTR